MPSGGSSSSNNNNTQNNNTNNNNTQDTNNTSNNIQNTNTNQNSNSNSPTVSTLSVQEVLIIPPSKTNYNVGEKLDLTGLQIIAIYPNNSIKEISKGYTIKGYNKNKVGDQIITITYQDFSRSYTVKVRDNSTNNSNSPNTNTNTNTNTNINNFDNIIANDKPAKNKNGFELKNLLPIILILSIIIIVIFIIKKKKE